MAIKIINIGVKLQYYGINIFILVVIRTSWGRFLYPNIVTMELINEKE